MKTRVTERPDGLRDVWAWSADRAELRRLEQSAARAGQLVWSICRRRGDRWELHAHLRTEGGRLRRKALPTVPAARRPPRAAWSLRWPQQGFARDAVTWLAAAALGVGVLVGLAWLVWQALSGAARAAVDNVWLVLIILAAILAAGCVVSAIRRPSSGGHRCLGVQHCASCRGR